jgi:hypothetical protein
MSNLYRLPTLATQSTKVNIGGKYYELENEQEDSYLPYSLGNVSRNHDLAMLVGTMIVLPMNSEAAEGKIWGIITDSNGQPIEDADLILTNVHTQTIYFAESDGAGMYGFYYLNAGYYQLMVEKDGYFNNKTDAPFRFDGSESLKMNFGLEKMPLKNQM